MKAEQIEQVVAPCGLDCFNCGVFESNVTEEIRQGVAAKFGIAPERVSCRGCRIEDGCKLHDGCSTLDCIKAKGVAYCHECDGFPCEKLQPASQGADTFPHNFKLYNLCRINAVGVTQWAQEEAAGIRERYFNGRFIPGRGPVLE
jgi:hypothetical protein